MGLLRDDSLVALNDLLIACREAADCHRTAAKASHDPDLAQELTALARDRDAMAEVLREAIVAQDDIPGAPNQEKELIEAALTRVKSVLSEDETVQLLDDCQAKEERVTETAESALGQNPDSVPRQKLAALRDDAASRMADLKRRYVTSRRPS